MIEMEKSYLVDTVEIVGHDFRIGNLDLLVETLRKNNVALAVADFDLSKTIDNKRFRRDVYSFQAFLAHYKQFVKPEFDRSDEVYGMIRDFPWSGVTCRRVTLIEIPNEESKSGLHYGFTFDVVKNPDWGSLYFIYSGYLCPVESSWDDA